MNSRDPVVTCLLAASLAMSACIAEGPSSLGPGHHPYQPDDEGVAGDGGDAEGGEATAPGQPGWPCEVEALLAEHCWSCHGATPPALDSLQALEAPSTSEPSKSVAVVSLETMQGVGSSMPPTGLLDAGSVALFAAWIDAGMPMDGCSEGPTTPTEAPVQCSTGAFWTNGDEGSHAMYPGRACIQCHDAKDEGPRYAVAGTVYPTLHEPDDCYGTVGSLDGAKVVITDANGQIHSLPIRDGGNFSVKDEVGVAFPVTAEVLVGTASIPMQGAIDAAGGDCNTCHSTTGTDGAPGRIVLP